MRLSEGILKTFNLKKGQKLLSVRGSGLALGLVSKGPIYREALNYSELNIY